MSAIPTSRATRPRLRIATSVTRSPRRGWQGQRKSRRSPRRFDFVRASATAEQRLRLFVQGVSPSALSSALAANNTAVATSTLNMRMICSRGSRSGSVSLSYPEGNAAGSFLQPPSAAHDCTPASAIDFVGRSAREVAGGRGHQQGLLLAVGNAGLSGFVPSVAAAMIEVSGLMRRHQLDHAQPQP